ncbi:MAG: TrkH family potassium uptake protein [Bacillales bacterium]
MKKIINYFKERKTLKKQREIAETILQNKPNIVSGIKLMLGYLGIFLITVGIIILIPIIITFIYRDELFHIIAFLIPGIFSISIGITFTLFLKGKKKARLGKYQDLVLLILIWFSACLFGSLPFMLPLIIGGLGLNFINSLFETVSGFATCGLSILEKEISPSNLLINHGKCFLFYRSIIMFFGGIGFVLIITCIISDAYGINLYYSEGHTDRLLPNLYKSAKLILSLYSSLVIIFSLLLFFIGMNPWTKINLPNECLKDPQYASYFEALCMSMTHLSSGGFSTRDLGIYAYNNKLLELVFEIMEIFAGTNFIIIFSLITLKFKKIIKDLDVRLGLLFSFIWIPILTLISLFNKGMNSSSLMSLGENIHNNIFFYISCFSTTGSSNVANMKDIYPKASFIILTIIMSMGGQQGSTCGGIKLYRVGLGLKGIYWNIREKNFTQNLIYPHYISKFGNSSEVSDKELSDAVTYIALYIGFLLFNSFLITLLLPGEDFLFALFESASALSGTGLSSGITSSDQNKIVLFIIIILMFVGRLEIYAFIYGFRRITHDIKELFKNLIRKIKSSKEKN